MSRLFLTLSIHLCLVLGGPARAALPCSFVQELAQVILQIQLLSDPYGAAARAHATAHLSRWVENIDTQQTGANLHASLPSDDAVDIVNLIELVRLVTSNRQDDAPASVRELLQGHDAQALVERVLETVRRTQCQGNPTVATARNADGPSGESGTEMALRSTGTVTLGLDRNGRSTQFSDHSLLDGTDGLGLGIGISYETSVLAISTMAGLGWMTISVIRRFSQIKYRRKRRYPTHYRTRISIDDEPTGVVMLDLNCFGTKFSHDLAAPPSNKSVLRIDLEGDWIEFDIAWSNNFCCGVKFAKRIKRAKVNSLRQSAINQYIGADMAKDVQAEDEIENGAQNRTPFKPQKG